ncbi:MAG TPA: fused MFS/spermidine synthase [Methylomirabilota bacterium]
MSQALILETSRGEVSAVRALFTVTAFTAAFLLFSVQPMFAKMVLPLFGSTPAVWNTCMVFFQTALLVGYATVHATTRLLPFRHQMTVHLGLLLGCTLVLPVAVPATWRVASSDHPVWSLLAILLLALGLPFFALSTIGPLAQAWFARSRDARARDPYFLYASSNLGSLVALLAYPTLVEPYHRLAEQSRLWSVGFLGVIGLVAACWLAVRYLGNPSDLEALRAADSAVRVPGPASHSGGDTGRWRWLLFAFIPSSLTLGLTTYITTDVAPMPLLWVIPLATYLSSFVLTFGRVVRVSPELASRLTPVLAVPVAATMALGAAGGFRVLVPLHLAALLVVSILCHGELARSRPAADRLTEFYLWLGLGGVLGSAFNALVAPAVFTGIVEYPLALVLACLVRRSERPPGTLALRGRDLGIAIIGAAAILALLGLPHHLSRFGELPALVTLGIPAAVCFALRHRPLSFALGLGALLLAPTVNLALGEEAVYRERSFFGVSQVRAYRAERLNLLLSGATNHGAQSFDPERRLEPLSYYHRTGPIGQIFAALPVSLGSRVAIMGLGTGTLACYGRPEQQFTFYEIDAAVVRIARDPRFFTFLQLCPPDVRIVLGDARLTFSEAPDRSYGLVVLDAFSSDAIPSHLLTREAVSLYTRKLVESGLLVVHISNNHLDLESTVANLAHDAGLVAIARFDGHVSPAEVKAGKSPSHWVVLARRRADLGALADDPRWHLLVPQLDKTLWTDDFSSILQVIRWR